MYHGNKVLAQSTSAKKSTARPSTDTLYVKSYSRELTGRIFLSQKYTSILVPGTSTIPSFRYRPNTTLNLGVGITYQSLTFNLAYGIPGINNDKERGTTRYADLQAHIYGRRIVADFFGQFYNGYYLTPKDYVVGYPGYYIRPDIKVRMIGTSAYYVFNNRKFSYRAALLQNEWQTRSAGTFLLGGDAYYGVINSDSTLVPLSMIDQFPQGRVKRMRFINIGPGGGYAYTFVYKRNWFATGSLTVNIPIDIVKEQTALEEKNDISLSPNFIIRVAAGYNSRRWSYTASFVNSIVTAEGIYNNNAYRISTGNYRLTVARRFTLNRKARKTIEPVENMLPSTGD